uniref:Uncharacterized protein n=1 Tax=Brassica oleracea var. oleracea TaxID=109376 RepID=A0A0D3CS23_BRAOL
MIRFVNQRIRNNVRSAAQANRFSSSSTIPLASCKDCDKAKQAEESLRTVMYLSCWATIGAVEASKDQLGLCRWNYMIRFVNQRIRNNVRSAAQANRFSSSSTIPLASCKDCDKAKQAEESLRTVMYLSCWGLN